MSKRKLSLQVEEATPKKVTSFQHYEKELKLIQQVAKAHDFGFMVFICHHPDPSRKGIKETMDTYETSEGGTSTQPDIIDRSTIYTTLHNTLNHYTMKPIFKHVFKFHSALRKKRRKKRLTVLRSSLKIKEKKYVELDHYNEKMSQLELANKFVDTLRQYCFFIEKKYNFKEYSIDDLAADTLSLVDDDTTTSTLSSDDVSSSTAKTESLSETYQQNKVLVEIEKVLREFKQTNGLEVLAFDEKLTKTERAEVHKLAYKLGLKSKSMAIFKENQKFRRVIVEKKLKRVELVEWLLKNGCENDYYKLHIPKKFQNTQTSKQ